MATINFSSNRYPGGGGNGNINMSGPGSSSSNRYSISQAEVVTFVHTSHGGMGVPAMEIGTTSSAIWSSPGTISVPHESAASKTIKASASLGNHTIVISEPYFSSRTVYITVVSNVDTTPDSFSLGPDISNATPNSVYDAQLVTVSGINASTVASCGGKQFKIGIGGTYSTGNKNVINGNTIYVRATANNNYSGTTTTVLNIGGVTDSWTITTTVDISAGEKIYLGISSGQIKLSDIKSFFGGTSAPNTLSSFLRSLPYPLVPNIAENSGVPTSLPIKLTDFYGSATSLVFTQPPLNRSTGTPTTSININSTAGVDWDLGFGPSMLSAVQIRYIVSNQQVSGMGSNPAAPSITTQGNLGTFSSGNTILNINLSTQSAQTVSYTGTITIQVRHPRDTSAVVSANFNYSMYFYGT